MAPKGKRGATDSAAATTTTRVTRSSTRRANPTDVPEPPKRKKAKTTTTTSIAAVAKQEDEPAPTGKETAKTIVVEHCKQCNSFKTRAIQVKNGLEESVEGVNVVVNPEKPRRGCFEIREESGEVFVSLLDMKRPFKPMKELDMEKVISDIVEKIR